MCMDWWSAEGERRERRRLAWKMAVPCLVVLSCDFDWQWIPFFFSLSILTGRSIDRQTEFTAAILFNLIRTKKPVVLVTTKNDEACEAYVKEAEKLVSRKEFRQSNVPIVETSAHDNVNVDVAFLLLAQLIDRVKNRLRPLSYNETARKYSLLYVVYYR